MSEGTCLSTTTKKTDDLLPFQFNVPLRKSKAPERRHGVPLWTIEGVASTENVDQQGERMIFKGMDFQPYLKSGVINWNHQDDPGAIIGEPIEARVIERSGKPALFFTKGFLYEAQPMAQRAWTLLSALEKSDQPVTRKLGWSVQGGVLERQGKDLVKSVVRHMALTHEPVNAQTWAKVVKSLVKSLQLQGVGIGDLSGPVAPGVPHSDLQPLIPQNLDSTFTTLMFTPCPNGCLDERTGQFAKGFHGMLDHLVLCKGAPIPQAKEFVAALVHHQGMS